MNQKKLEFFKLFYPLSRVEKKKKRKKRKYPLIYPLKEKNKKKKEKTIYQFLIIFFLTKKNFFSVLPTEYSEKLQNFNH